MRFDLNSLKLNDKDRELGTSDGIESEVRRVLIKQRAKLERCELGSWWKTHENWMVNVNCFSIGISKQGNTEDKKIQSIVKLT